MSALAISGVQIRRDGDLVCLTDMWRASGADKKKRPLDYLRFEGASLVSHYEKKAMWCGAPDEKAAEVVRTDRGGKSPATWAQEELAYAYAEWISVEFHALVLGVFRAFVQGRLVGARESRAEQELIAYKLRVRALEESRSSIWPKAIKVEFARLRKLAWSGTGVEPKGLSFAYGRTWRWILGDVVYEELHRRNPTPSYGTLHSAWLTECAYDETKTGALVTALVLARQSASWADYEAQMRFAFGRAPLQLTIGGARGNLRLLGA